MEIERMTVQFIYPSHNRRPAARQRLTGRELLAEVALYACGAAVLAAVGAIVWVVVA